MEDLMVNGERSDLKVDSDKNKMMKVMTTQARGVRIGQDLLEQLFQYLRSIINITDGTNEDIVGHISKVRQVFAMLKPVWRSSPLSCKTKHTCRIFSSNVKLVLLYRAETCRTIKDLVNKIQGFVNKCLWSLLGIRWPEEI